MVRRATRLSHPTGESMDTALDAIGGVAFWLDDDLTTGTARQPAQRPWPALDLALVGDRPYAPDPPGDRLRVVDRRRGRLLRPVTGRPVLGGLHHTGARAA